MKSLELDILSCAPVTIIIIIIIGSTAQGSAGLRAVRVVGGEGEHIGQAGGSHHVGQAADQLAKLSAAMGGRAASRLSAADRTKTATERFRQTRLKNTALNNLCACFHDERHRGKK